MKRSLLLAAGICAVWFSSCRPDVYVTPQPAPIDTYQAVQYALHDSIYIHYYDRYDSVTHQNLGRTYDTLYTASLSDTTMIMLMPNLSANYKGQIYYYNGGSYISTDNGQHLLILTGNTLSLTRIWQAGTSNTEGYTAYITGTKLN